MWDHAFEWSQGMESNHRYYHRRAIEERLAAQRAAESEAVPVTA
jgi:hypothetical protein